MKTLERNRYIRFLKILGFIEMGIELQSTILSQASTYLLSKYLGEFSIFSACFINECSWKNLNDIFPEHQCVLLTNGPFLTTSVTF